MDLSACSDSGARRDARGRLGGFDYFVLAGAAVNALVIACLVGFWLFGR